MVISEGHLSGEGANAQHAFSINAVTILLKVYKVYLFIYLAEIRFVRGLVDTEVMVGQRVTLTCETSDDVASVDWLRNDEHLASRDQTGCHAYELSAGAGRVHWLTILSAARSDEAKYTCTCGDDVTSGLLLVEGASNALVIIIIITSRCSTYSERPRRCCTCRMTLDRAGYPLYFTVGREIPHPITTSLGDPGRHPESTTQTPSRSVQPF